MSDDKRLDQVAAAVAHQGADIVPVVQSGSPALRRTTLTAIRNWILSLPAAFGNNITIPGSVGNLGIGTGAPSNKLHVSTTDGNIALFAGSTSAVRIRHDEISATDPTGVVSFAPLTISTAELRITNGAHTRPGANNAQDLGTTSFRWRNILSVGGNFSGNVTASGSVGIGTETPNGRLHLAVAAAPTGLTTYGLRATTTSTEFGARFGGFIDQGVDHGAFVETITSGTATRRLTVLSNGNLGVAASAPAMRLHLVSPNGNVALFSGSNVAFRVGCDATRTELSATDATGVVSFQPLHLAGSVVAISANAVLRPNADNTQSLGNASFRWSTVFAGTGTINTSDARQKVKRGEFTDVELDAWGDVQPLVFRWKDSVERKGDAARQHAGYIAQEIAAAFEAHGLDASDYGLWCEDSVVKIVKRIVTKPVKKMRKISTEVVEVEIRDGKPVQVRKTVEREEPEVEMVEVRDEAGLVVCDSDGKPLMHPVPVMEEREVEEVEEVPDGTRLGLRYDQCAVFEAAWARREIERLRARIDARKG